MRLNPWLKTALVWAVIILGYFGFRWVAETKAVRDECASFTDVAGQIGPIDIERCRADVTYRNSMIDKASSARDAKESKARAANRAEFEKLKNRLSEIIGSEGDYTELTDEYISQLSDDAQLFLSTSIDLSDMSGEKPSIPRGTKYVIRGSIMLGDDDGGQGCEDDKYEGMISFGSYQKLEYKASAENPELPLFIGVKTDNLIQYQRALLLKHCEFGCNGMFYISVMSDVYGALALELLGARLTQSRLDSEWN